MEINIFQKVGAIALVLLMVFVVFSAYKDRSGVLKVPNREIKEGQKKANQSNQLNIYYSQSGTAVDEAVVDMFQRFTKESGIVINYQLDTFQNLLNQYDTEKNISSADIFIFSSFEEMLRAREKKMLQSVLSKRLNAVSDLYHDNTMLWHGFAARIRPVFYAKKHVKSKSLVSYEDLSNESWREKILLPAYEEPGSQLLLATMLKRLNSEKVSQWLYDTIKNTARPPQGTSADQLRALGAGIGDVTIAGSDDYLRMKVSKDANESQLVKNIGVFLPGRRHGGVAFDMQIISLMKAAINEENAKQFIDFVFREDTQKSFSEKTRMFPVVGKAPFELGAFEKWEKSITTDEGLSLSHLTDADLIAEQQGWQ